MARLPVLVEHGAIVWKLVIAAAAAVAIALARRHRRRRAAVCRLAEGVVTGAGPDHGAGPLARALGIGLATAGVATAALYGGGRLALSLGAMDRVGPLVPARLGALDAVSLAAATPGNRDAALDEIEARFARRYQRTPLALAAWQEVARVRGGCGGELRMRTAEDQIDGLAALARSCDDGPAAADALRALGFHDEAYARHPPGAGRGWESRADLVAVVAAGRWQDAAARLADWRARLRALDGKPRTGLACLAQWLRGRAGGPALAARIEHDPRAPLCAVIDALSLPREAQAIALAAVAGAGGPLALDARDADGTVEALAWAAGAALDPRDADGTVEAASRSIPMRPRIALEAGPLPDAETAVALLAPGARAARSDPPATLGFVRTQFWTAVHAMLRGDLAGARAEAQAAQRGDPAGDGRVEAWQHDAGSLEILLAVRAGEPLPPGAEHHGAAEPDAMAIALGDVLPATRLPLRGELEVADPDRLEALRAALAGDASRLDELIATRGLEVATGIAPLFALWPRVTHARDRLASALRQIAPGRAIEDGPLARIAYAALRRDLALLIGDRPAAAGWQGIVDRDLAVFADRDRLLGSILLGLAQGELR